MNQIRLAIVLLIFILIISSVQSANIVDYEIPTIENRAIHTDYQPLLSKNPLSYNVLDKQEKSVEGSVNSSVPDTTNTVENSSSNFSRNWTYNFQTSSTMVISNPGVYTLTNDIINSGDTFGIWIQSSDVKIIGNNHLVDGINAANSNGIVIWGPSKKLTNVTLENVRIQEFGYGIQINNADTINCTQITSKNNINHGISCYGSSNTQFLNSFFENNGLAGIALESSSKANIQGTNCNNNINDYGIVARSSSFIDITSNSINNNGLGGILYMSTNTGNVIGNYISGNLNGILITESSTNITIQSNTILKSKQSGIQILNGSSNITIIGGDLVISGIDQASSNGIVIWGSTNKVSTVSIQNVNVQNFDYGLQINNATGITISQSQFQNSIRNGVSCYNSSKIQLLNNYCDNNGMAGIALEQSSIVTMNGNNCNNNKNNYGVMVTSSSQINTNNNFASNNGIGGILYSSSDTGGIIGNYLEGNTNGILISNSCKNLIIQSNTIKRSIQSGVQVVQGVNLHTNITIKSNTIQSSVTESGINIAGCSQSTIEQNEIFDNNLAGIDMSDCTGIYITRNNIFNCVNDIGLVLIRVNNIIARGNNVYNNHVGIYLESSSNNQLIDNIVRNNSFYEGGLGTSVGLFTNSNDNKIFSNTITESQVGLTIKASTNNLVYNNYFNNNINQNIIAPGTTTWNTGKTKSYNIVYGNNLGGNFWAKPDNKGYSQLCSDVNKDGICDSAYVFTGGNDNLPLVDKRGSIGIHRGNIWYLDNNIDGVPDKIIAYGLPSDKPVTGDWDGNGKFGIGVIRGNIWYLDNYIDGVPDKIIGYGLPSDKHITGDWDGDGKFGIGVIRGNIWYLDNDIDGVPDKIIAFGLSSDKPITGDWDGDGKFGIGVIRGNIWYLDNIIDGIPDRIVAYGSSTDFQISGHFNSDTFSNIAVFRNGGWYFDLNLDGKAEKSINYGITNDIPLVMK